MRAQCLALSAVPGVVFGVVLAVVLGLSATGHARSKAPPATLDCASLDCAAVLPGAARFEAVPGTRYQAGFDGQGGKLGFVVLSTDVVDVQAYSGKPLVTLIGVDLKGVITGARVVHHSEPILLVGIPESALQRFVGWYAGKPVATHVVVGESDRPGAVSVDAISGATVTALAQNQTLLEAARKLAVDVGVLKAGAGATGRFIEEDRVMTWAELERARVFGRLWVSEAQMGSEAPGAERAQFINLWFTIADAPQVGRALLGDRDYAWMKQRLAKDEHIVVVFGVGSSSFKGSGFVRGGIFDRVRIEQGMGQLIFRDTDYKNLSSPVATGAPRFKEGAAFIARGGKLNPALPFDLVFVASQYDGKGGFSRTFRSFSATHQLPASVYQRDRTALPEAPVAVHVQAWRNQRWRALFVATFLLMVMGLFAARRWLTSGGQTKLRRVHIAVMLASTLILGFGLKAQPSVTQLLTFVDGAVHGFRWTLFLSEPLLFISWIFIALVTLIWGRGVFCGWTCPFGAGSELLFKLGRVLKLPEYELPDRIHKAARWVRYGVLAGLVVSFLWSSTLGEQLAEIEPFKTTFFVAPWTRHWGFVAWWGLLVGVSFVWWRPFCRYLCPLGAGLALPGSFRLSGPYRRQACHSCRICTRTCEPKAIREDGSIDPRECLSCMECEANYRDEQVCPPLVGIERLTLRSRQRGVEPDPEKLARLERSKAPWTREGK